MVLSQGAVDARIESQSGLEKAKTLGKPETAAIRIRWGGSKGAIADRVVSQ